MIRTVQHERMKFLVIATKTDVEVYAWAQKPYSKFMQFKVSYCLIKAALSAYKILSRIFCVEILDYYFFFILLSSPSLRWNINQFWSICCVTHPVG